MGAVRANRRARLFEFSNVKTATLKQLELAKSVSEKAPKGFEPELVCGLDAAYGEASGVGVAAVWKSSESRIVEVVHIVQPVRVPYIPGFFGFREGPLVIAACEKLGSRPDVFLVDGHGRAHPRRFGIACHIGLALNRPTVGVAKSRLYGSASRGRLLDPAGETIGRILNSGGRTHYISVGHKIGLADAYMAVKSCVADGFPAPLRSAHLEATRLRRSLGP